MELNWKRLRKGLVRAAITQVVLEIVLSRREARA